MAKSFDEINAEFSREHRLSRNKAGAEPLNKLRQGHDEARDKPLSELRQGRNEAGAEALREDTQGREEAAPKSKTAGMISSITFYGMLVLLLFVVFTYTQSGASRSMFGYSYYNILTTSMQSTIPQGSFILVKETPGEELQVGDDITFFKNADTIVTHRIIGIQANYEDSGQYGFRTQGTDNPTPDKEVTFEGNVIGKVVLHIPMLGFVLEYIADNIWLVVIGFALLLALSYFLKIVFTPEKPKEKKSARYGRYQ